jgi:hypothetical protein
MTRLSANTHVLGLDVGAVSLSAVEVDAEGRIVRAFQEFHRGHVKGCLQRFLKTLDQTTTVAVAATTSTPSFVRADGRFDNQICLITSARRLYPQARSLLVIGAERFGLVRFDALGHYLSFRANPLCAAGTGGFLDQQARRLNLAGSQDLAALALANRAPPATGQRWRKPLTAGASLQTGSSRIPSISTWDVARTARMADSGPAGVPGGLWAWAAPGKAERRKRTGRMKGGANLWDSIGSREVKAHPPARGWERSRRPGSQPRPRGAKTVTLSSDPRERQGAMLLRRHFSKLDRWP